MNRKHTESSNVSGKWRIPLYILVVLAGALCAWWLDNRTDHEMREDLLTRANLTAEALNTENVEVLTGTEADLESSQYLRLKEQFAAIRATEPKCHVIYLLGQKAGSDIFIFLDSEPAGSKDYSPPGQVYVGSTDGFRRVFGDRKATVEGPVTDRWGISVSALVPLTDPRTGKLIAVFGMDIDARVWRRYLVARTVLPVGLTTLGLLAILFMAFSLLDRRARLEGSPSRLLPHLEPAMVIAGGLVLTLFAAWLAQDDAERRRVHSFRYLAESRTNTFADKLRALRDMQIEGLARLFQNSENVTPEEFRDYTTKHLQKSRGVQAWEWIPAVPAADKDRFEQAARAAGMDGFQIWQRDSAGNRVPATGREWYYPVFQVTPVEGNQKVIGYDLGSEPVRAAAIREALRTGLSTATEPVTLVQETGTQKGMLLFRPVFADARQQKPRGLALAVLRLGDALAATITVNLVPEELLLARGDGSSERLAASWIEDKPPTGVLTLRRPIPCFGKTFIVAAHAGAEFLHDHPVRAGWGVGLAGLLLTAALAVVVSVLTRRRQTLEGLVVQRTASLRESEEHLSATLRSIGDGVIVCDGEGRVTILNHTAEALTGWSAAEAVGRPLEEIFRIIHAQTRNPVENPVGRTLAEGVNVDLANHTALIAKDGVERQIADSCAPIRDASGTVAGAVLVFRDVTEEYRRREERLRISAAVESTADAISMSTADGHHFYQNEAFTRLFGYELDEVTKLQPTALFADPDDAKAVFQTIMDGGSIQKELVMIAKDGRRLHILQRADCIRDEDGRIIGLMGVHSDITAQKLAEEALRESEQQLRLTQEISHLGGWVLDLTHNRLNWSDEVYRIFGLMPQDVCPTYEEFLERIHPDDRQKVNDAYSDSLRENRDIYEVEHRIIRKDTGEVRIVYERCVHFRDATGKIIRSIGTVHDITERKQREAAEHMRSDRITLQAEILITLTTHPALTAGDVQAFATAMTEMVGRSLGISRVGVWLFNASEKQLSCLDNFITADGRHESGAVLDEAAFANEFAAMKTARFVDAHDAQTDPRTAGYVEGYLKPLGITAMLDGVVRSEGHHLGTVCFEYVGVQHHWGDDETAFVCQLCDQVALTIANRDRRQAEEALAKQAALLEGIIGSTTDVIFTKDINGVYLDCNKPFLDLVAKTKEQVIGKTDYDLFPKEIADVIREKDAQMMRAGSPQHNDEWVDHPDGRRILFNTMKAPLHMGDGSLVGMVGVSRDITDRKRAEEEMEKTSVRLLLATQAGGVGVWDYDILQNQLVWDDQMYALYGITSDTFGGAYESWRAGLHPEDVERGDKEIQMALSGEKEFNTEFRVLWPSGEVRYIRALAKVLRDADGKPLRMVGTNWDITDRKLAEEEMEKTSVRLLLATQAGGEGVWDYDILQNQLVWDDQMYALYGITRDTFGGAYESWRAGVHPEDVERGDKEVQMALSGEKEFNTEFRVLWPSGEVRHIRAQARVLRDADGKPLRMVGTNWDITERKRAEEEMQETNRQLEEATAHANEMAAQAEAASRAKSDFLANMSHEIRTPMNAITGMAYLALQTNLDPRQYDYVSKIQQAADSLLRIINDILDFSKIEAGKLELESIPFKLGDLFDHLATITSGRAEEKGLEILFSLPVGFRQTLLGDPLRLGQVLGNLAGNAVKFTEKGHVIIAVELAGALENNSIPLTFSIQDTGIGMSSDQLTLVFEAFSQADNSITRKYGGTGLGLSIVNRLLALMDSSLKVESEPGRGSRFSFTVHLPLAEEPLQKPADMSENLMGLRVLVVDDNAAAREILGSMMTSFRFNVTAVDSGGAAVAEIHAGALSGDPYSLVLMDWMMPEMDGFEAIRRIREDNTLVQPPAIVMVTAFGGDELRRQVLQLEKTAYVTKPVQPSAMFNTILELFGIGERQSVRYRRANILQMDGLKRIRGARVLVVEDNTINQQVAREIIEQGGILVSIAGNGHTAVALIEAGEEFDAVLMDIQMPDMNGYEACRIIRQSRSAEELPIIAMSAHAMAEDREKCLAAGMNDYVSKPVNPQELYTSLITWIKRDITEPPFNDQSQSSVRQREKHSNLPASLPGLDVASGVMRAGGNRRLYCQILADFKEQNRNVVEELRTALECSDSGRAAAIAHTLKGLSATIGAMSLAATVSDLEQAVKADAGDTCSVLFSRLEQQLAELFESVSILKAAQLFSETDDTVVTPLPQDEFEALIRTLHESLRNNSLGARKYVELLHGQIGGLEWKELNKYTSQLDYEKAADVLERIAKQGGFNLHGGK